MSVFYLPKRPNMNHFIMFIMSSYTLQNDLQNKSKKK